MQKPPQIACSSQLYKVQTRYIFHSNIKIKIPVQFSDALLDDLFYSMEQIDRKYNSYAPDSYFDRINRNAGEFVEVDDVTISMLRTIISISDIFEGIYDISIMPLLKLWGFYSDNQVREPNEIELFNTLKNVDYRKITIRGNQVKIDKNQQLITGSFLKAYAVDKVVEILKNEGITDALVNAGGSTIYGMAQHPEDSWPVNTLKSTASPEIMFTANLKNKCYSTSAQFANQITINGKAYGHILNAQSGYPSANKQAGIVSDSCFIGDICSTAIFNCDKGNFSSFIAKLKMKFDLDGFLMDQEDHLIQSTHFNKYLVKA